MFPPWLAEEEEGGEAGKETQDKQTIRVKRRRRNTVLLPCLAYNVIEAGGKDVQTFALSATAHLNL